MTEALKSKYPYAYSYAHDVSGNIPNDGLSPVPPCLDLVPLSGCLIANCSSAGPAYRDLIGCAFEHCAPYFQVLSDECWSCIRTSGPAFSDIVQRFVIRRTHPKYL